MSAVELIGLVLSIALFAYLLVALLKPEWFS
jgi:K+-transporting ATPase KdpF subunit